MNSKATSAYEFGPFRLEPSEYRLLRDGSQVLLTPKAFQTLLVLVEHAGHVVEKQEMMRLVWADAIVEEAIISQNIFTLRKTLGASESGLPYIETVPKRGYRLAVPVREIGATPSERPIVQPDAVRTPAALQRPPTFRRRLMIGSVGIAAVAIVSFGVLGSVGWEPSGSRETRGPTITRLTNAGNAGGASISPNGKFLAYVQNNLGQQSLWLKLVGTDRATELVPLAAERIQAVTFSRDSNWIYYVRESTLFAVSVMGGPVRAVQHRVGSALTISPSGTQFAYIHGEAESGESAIVVASANAKTVTVAARKVPQYFRSLAWAPGRDVIVATVGTRAGERYMTLTEIAVKTGHERPLTSHKWYEAREIAWFPDETGLVVSASSRPSEPFQLWKVSYPDGNVTKVTNDLDDYYTPGLTTESADLVSSRRTEVSSVWVSDAGLRETQRVTAQGGESERPSWTPDGRIVYESRVSGNRDVWIMDADGSDKKQLTFDAAVDHSPSAAPGGDHVYFVSDRIEGIPHIWRMAIDGSSPTQLTSGEGEMMPDCSPDGTWLVYESVASGRPLLWRVSTGGGTSTQLTNKLSRSPAISPDGKLIAMYYWDERPESPIRVAVIRSAGGPPIKLFDFPDTIPSRIVRWSADGRAIHYIVNEDGISNIWSQPLDGGPAKPVTRFGADVITFFNWSRSGEQLAFSRRVRTQDVVLISNFK